MRRIGMTRDPADDFLHPNLPEGIRSARTSCTGSAGDAWERSATG